MRSLQKIIVTIILDSKLNKLGKIGGYGGDSAKEYIAKLESKMAK